MSSKQPLKSLTGFETLDVHPELRDDFRQSLKESGFVERSPRGRQMWAAAEIATKQKIPYSIYLVVSQSKPKVAPATQVVAEPGVGTDLPIEPVTGVAKRMVLIQESIASAEGSESPYSAYQKKLGKTQVLFKLKSYIPGANSVTVKVPSTITVPESN